MVSAQRGPRTRTAQDHPTSDAGRRDAPALPPLVGELLEVVQSLSVATEMSTVREVVLHAVRRITGADGVTFVVRDGDYSSYVDEDAIAPLWKGQRFPSDTCLSGWAMENGLAAVIPDVTIDDRIPQDLYRPTFVRSLAMVPIRAVDPLGAIGAYWSDLHTVSRSDLEAVQAIADATAVTMERIRSDEELAHQLDELARANRELEHSRTLHRIVNSMVRLGGWSLDLADGRAVWSEELFDILGYPRDHDPNLDNGLAMYPPEYRAELEVALELCATEGTPFDLELEVFDHSRNRLWVQVMGEAQIDRDGAITHITGAFQDISEKKESRRQQELLTQRLTTTLESITDGFLTVDRDWQLTSVNRRGEEIIGRSRDELLGEHLWRDTFPQAVGTVVDEVQHRAMRTGVSEVIEDFYWEPLDIWLTVHVYPSDQGLALYFRDVSDQHQAQQALHRLNAELNDANAQLEDAAQLKDDLLSMASHELRTPLTPIRGFLETLRTHGTDLTHDQVEMMLSAMDRHAARMVRLVDDLLVVSRASAGKLDSRPEQVSAREVLVPVVDELADTGAQIELALGGCQLVVDPRHLQQIVLNLLTNAVKYGAPPIVVTAARRGEARVALEVIDNGAGVPPGLEAQMWDRFVQSDRGDRRTATGVGLGLAIVKLLADVNHGSVGYRRGSPTGAVFTIELPGQLASHGPADRQTADQ